MGNFDTNNEDFRHYFSKFGDVTDSIIMTDKATGKSRGFGFIVYSHISMVDEVMEKRPHTLDGRTISPKRAVSKEETEKNNGALSQVKKIFVGGIKEDTEEEHIRDVFKNFGEIESIEVLTDRDTQKKRGFAFVTFLDHDVVDKIVTLKTHTINGHSCEVKKAIPKTEIKSSSLTTEGEIIVSIEDHHLHEITKGTGHPGLLMTGTHLPPGTSLLQGTEMRGNLTMSPATHRILQITIATGITIVTIQDMLTTDHQPITTGVKLMTVLLTIDTLMKDLLMMREDLMKEMPELTRLTKGAHLPIIEGVHLQ